MRFVFSLILSAFILIQSLGFNINSLVQIDDLWEHYQEHRTEYGDSLLTFLDLHYGSQQQDHEDEHPEHQDLPSQQSFHVHYTYFVDAKPLLIKNEYPTEKVQHNFGYSISFKSLLETDILQPPKTLI